MKIQIDTEQKTIVLEEAINLGDLAKKLNKLFPNKTWKEYKLEVKTITQWSNPIVIKEYPYYPWHYYPWITYNNTSTITTNSNTNVGGMFNDYHISEKKMSINFDDGNQISYNSSASSEHDIDEDQKLNFNQGQKIFNIEF